ncbi:MAG TPA: hypothetical protein VGK79_01965 [Gaiellaceae bacterium]
MAVERDRGKPLVSLLATPARQGAERAAARRTEIRCADCGYGGVVARLPDRCPMCGGVVWRERSRRSGRADQTTAAV